MSVSPSLPQTNIERFHEAMVHTEHVVMGRRLSRFTLRHRLWLEAMGSPLVKGGKASLQDLELAARVCSVSFADLERAVPAMLRRGPGRIGKWWFALRALWTRADVEYLRFQAYFVDHGCPPATWNEVTVEGEGEVPSDSPLPPLLGLVSGLMHGGMTDIQAVWALSPGEAEWYLTGIFTHRGVDLKLKSELDEVFERLIRQEEAAEAAKPGAVGTNDDAGIV